MPVKTRAAPVLTPLPAPLVMAQARFGAAWAGDWHLYRHPPGRLPGRAGMFHRS
jgi:hypothetical protein